MYELIQCVLTLYPHNNPMGKYYYFPNFTKEETEAQKASKG